MQHFLLYPAITFQLHVMCLISNFLNYETRDKTSASSFNISWMTAVRLLPRHEYVSPLFNCPFLSSCCTTIAFQYLDVTAVILMFDPLKRGNSG